MAKWGIFLRGMSLYGTFGLHLTQARRYVPPVAGIEVLEDSHWSRSESVPNHPSQTSWSDLLLAIQIISAWDSGNSINGFLVDLYRALPFSCPLYFSECRPTLIIGLQKARLASPPPLLPLANVWKGQTGALWMIPLGGGWTFEGEGLDFEVRLVFREVFS